MKKENIIEIIICSSILVILCIFIFTRKELTTKVTYKYITDTIWSDTVWVPSEPLKVYTKPKTVTIYKTDTASLNNIKIILLEKDIIIQSLRDSISIHHNYLKQYPRNPKLLGLNLSKDSLDITLLNIEGNIHKQYWPLDLNTYGYNYASTLTRQPISTSQQKGGLLNSLEVRLGGGLDLLYRSPYIHTTIEKNWASTRVYSSISIGLLNSKSSSIQIGADYRLWQNRQ